MIINLNRKKLFIIILFIAIASYAFSTFEIIETQKYKFNLYGQHNFTNNRKSPLTNDDYKYDIILVKLQQLHRLLSEDLINREEYEIRKNQILDRFTGTTMEPTTSHIIIDSSINVENGTIVNNRTGYVYPRVIAYNETIIDRYGYNETKTKFIVQKPVNITIDIMIPFPSSRVEGTLKGLDRWSQLNKLPCDKFTVSDYYPGAVSNLVLYQNRDQNYKTENRFLDKINNATWRKCFNEIKFVYADLSVQEDKYPHGVSKMFYKYFDYNIGPPSDFFFWIETDVNPLRSDWQIELFRVTILNLEARQNKPFYSMGSNARHVIPRNGETRSSQVYHINGNALYWRNKSWYDSFLVKVENWPKRTNYFDCDIAYYFEVNDNWDSVKEIYQEFIHYEFIQNLGHQKYDELQFIKNNPRTFLINYCENYKINKSYNNNNNNNNQYNSLIINNLTIDIVIPFSEKEINIVLESLNKWNHIDKLPCNEITIQDYFKYSQSNLIFYQNFKENKENENMIIKLINSNKWKKCFKEIKFIYANNLKSEDKYPIGISKMFYKYFKIGSKSDYFFWFEPDVNPIKSDWLIEVFRVVSTTQQARSGTPFYIMGSNNKKPIFSKSTGDRRPFHSYHINGNAIYRNSLDWYNNFLINIENWSKSYGSFDVDILYYLFEPENWNQYAEIFQEFIYYEIIQNYPKDYQQQIFEKDFSLKNPRTYFVHTKLIK